MADIQKCTGEKNGVICGVRESCYRFTAPSGLYQAYGEPASDFLACGSGCSFFWSKQASCIVTNETL